MANDRTVTGNEAQFNEKVIFLKDIEVAGTIIGELKQDIITQEISATDLNISGNSNLYNLNVTGLGTFTKRLDVGMGGTLFTAINADDGVPNHQGRVGIGTTQPDGLFQVGNKCLTIVVDPCRVGIATTQPDARLQVGAGFTSFNVTSDGDVGIGITKPSGKLQIGLGFTSFNVSSDGNVGIGSTQPSAKFQLGLGNTSVSITGFGSIGVGVTNPASTFHLDGNNSAFSIISGLSTNTLRVGIGTTMPWSTPFTASQREGADGVNLLNDSGNGPLRLSVDGSIAISKNIYDSAGSPGGNNWWLRRDETGIRWVAVEPERSDGIFIQDEGTYIPSAGAAASFSTLNFVQDNSLGVGTDTLVPTVGNGTKSFTGNISNGSPTITGISGQIPAVGDIITIVSGNENITLAGEVKVQTVDNATQVTLDASFGGTGTNASGVEFLGNSNAYGAAGLSTIFTKDLWGFVDSDTADHRIYRMTQVGIKQDDPQFDLDVNGTLNVEGKATFNDETNPTSSDSEASVHIDGGVGIVMKLFVGDDTKVESDTGATGSDAVAALQVVGGTAIGEKLFIGDDTKVESNTGATGSDAVAALWVQGGTAIKEKLFVGKDTKIESDTGATASNAVAALQVVGGTAIGEKLFIGDDTKVESDTGATGSDAVAALQVVGGVAIGEKLFIGDDTKVEKDTQSNATDEGALQVVGGTGIGKNLYVGEDTNIGNDLYVGAASTFVGVGTFKSEVGVGGSIIVAGLSTFIGVSTFRDDVYAGQNVVVAGFSTFVEDSKFEDDVTIDENLYVGAASTVVGVATFKDDVGIGKTLLLKSYLRDINSDTGTGENPVNVGIYRTDWRLTSVGAGVSWRPSGVQTKRTIWVSKNGNDANSGLLEGDAKATIGGAAAIAEENDTIKIRAGIYLENNPVGLKTDVSITGEDLRLVTVIPNNPDKDVFHVRNGCLVENLNFAGKGEKPIETEHYGAGAVAFPPDTEDDKARSGYIALGPFNVPEGKRYKSPYVRNCTNFMTGSIGMKIDGSHATAVEAGQDLKSMVCDSFTQYNENGIGVSLTNNAYAQLVSIFTINADIGIYADTGGQCDLTNSNSSFGNFGLVAVGLGSTQFTGKVSNVNPAGAIVGSTSAENQDIVVCNDVFQKDTTVARRPFDGQALFFKINLDNYPDVQGTGILEEPLQQLESIKLRPGVDLSGFSAIDPPSVIIRDADSIQEPKGPQGIIAEATATVNAKGVLTEIDVIAQGRNYLPTQNIEVSIEGDTTLADAVMKPIYYTVDSATEPTASGICTITFNEFIPYELFPDDEFSLQRISRILTSSHSFEYIGSGTDINTSTPLQGAIPIKENEIVASDGAQIPFTSTDQKGNFDIGEGIQIDQTTSTIRGRDFSRAIQAEVTPLILALR